MVTVKKAVKEVVKKAGKAPVERVSMRKRIFELAVKHYNRTDILKIMKEEGYHRIRAAYIFIVLKKVSYLTPLH